MKRIVNIAFISFCCAWSTGCATDFLDVKQDQSLRIPNSLEDAEALVQGIVYNTSARELAIASGDEYQLTDGIFNGLRNIYKKNAYIWADSVYLGEDIPDWNRSYYWIMYANLALEVLDRLPPNTAGADHIRGTALFHRAYNHYMLSQTFIPPFQQTELDIYGLPLRLESDVSNKIGRASVSATYAQMLNDLIRASTLIEKWETNRFKPSRRACHALLARLYLLMDDYGKAYENAEICLDIDSRLMNFSELNVASNFSFPADLGLTNNEIIFYDNLATSVFGNSAPINMHLIDLYTSGDLRKSCYFRVNNGNYLFRGSYTGGNSLFCGLANDEIYLIKAEALTHLNRLTEANATLNNLLKHRYQPEDFVPLAINNRDQLLQEIYNERRKELVLRGTRWEDLRRLGWKEGNRESVIKKVNGVAYTLHPRDFRYTLPIPEKELEFGALSQNPR